MVNRDIQTAIQGKLWILNNQPSESMAQRTMVELADIRRDLNIPSIPYAHYTDVRTNEDEGLTCNILFVFGISVLFGFVISSAIVTNFV